MVQELQAFGRANVSSANEALYGSTDSALLAQTRTQLQVDWSPQRHQHGPKDSRVV
jgi:hypothetical protein